MLLLTASSAMLSAQHRNHGSQPTQKINNFFSYLRENYVDEIDIDSLVDVAIAATLRELDPHSSFISTEQMESMRASIEGEFSGIGITFIFHQDTAIVRKVMADSPAHDADIRKNDRIMSVDGESLIGVSNSRAIELIRGSRGSYATLDIKRSGESEPITIRVRRNDITVSSIDAAMMLSPRIGYIRINTFSLTTPEDFTAAYRSLNDVSTLIIDLRSNTGGSLSAAIRLTEKFLQRGDIIVSTEGRSNHSVYRTSTRGELADLPIIVLINEASASASEIFAGALQDHDRAVIVGRTSFGKGLVQRQVEFNDGSGMRLTIARYLTPSGRIIQRPYNNGDSETYFNDRTRYMHPDSVEHPDSLIFYTLHNHRRVYGGGGITPDIYISHDDEPIEPFTSAMLEHNIDNSVIINIFDRIPINEFLAEYPTLDIFIDNYELDNEAMDYLTTLVGEVREPQRGDRNGHRQSAMIIKARIADDVYGNGAYYKTYNREDDAILQRAFDIASTRGEISRILGSRR